MSFFQGETRYVAAFRTFFSDPTPALMHHYHYSGHNLHCESVDLAAVAKLYGTPTYV